MNVDRSSQQPAACLSCHILGISSASALGGYMFYRAKKANSSTHRFTCALFGLGMRIFSFFVIIKKRVFLLVKQEIVDFVMEMVKDNFDGFLRFYVLTYTFIIKIISFFFSLSFP
jgi:hypothetical protein